ncbi:MAG: RNA polymerase factor sigma-54 [Planctomycetaceae bacterium]
MHMNFSQQMRMSQQMKLAPRMIQSMEILQLPLMELQERIDQEMSENPTLLADADLDGESDTERNIELAKAKEEATETPVEARELKVEDNGNNEADFERLLEMHENWNDDSFNSESRHSSSRISEDGERHLDQMASLQEDEPTLIEYLLEQFHFYDNPPAWREFGEYLIYNLDADGRLQSSLPELAQVFGHQITNDEALTILQQIQKLDPTGVGARDVRECLLLQVTDDMPLRDVVVTIITSHFEDLAENRLPVIERKTGYSIDAIKMAREEMRERLDPHPGRRFKHVPVQTVTPDVFLEQDDHGKYAVRLSRETLPQLRISPKYIDMLRNGCDATTKEFVKRKIESAKWLIESIEQRHNTLKRVAQAIVDRQTEFLDKGPEFIAPLKMQQIADVVGVHVTTVSRAVDDKWIQTPRGLFPLKRFFGGGTKGEDGEDDVAWAVIRIKLQEVIDKEDKNDPLSDDDLVGVMQKLGYTLARRTVTKYRKKLNIPSSRQRRQY